jgi:hypothetical protein
MPQPPVPDPTSARRLRWLVPVFALAAVIVLAVHVTLERRGAQAPGTELGRRPEPKAASALPEADPDVDPESDPDVDPESDPDPDPDPDPDLKIPHISGSPRGRGRDPL